MWRAKHDDDRSHGSHTSRQGAVRVVKGAVRAVKAYHALSNQWNQYVRTRMHSSSQAALPKGGSELVAKGGVYSVTAPGGCGSNMTACVVCARREGTMAVIAFSTGLGMNERPARFR